MYPLPPVSHSEQRSKLTLADHSAPSHTARTSSPRRGPCMVCMAIGGRTVVSRCIRRERRLCPAVAPGWRNEAQRGSGDHTHFRLSTTAGCSSAHRHDACAWATTRPRRRSMECRLLTAAVLDGLGLAEGVPRPERETKRGDRLSEATAPASAYEQRKETGCDTNREDGRGLGHLVAAVHRCGVSGQVGRVDAWLRGSGKERDGCRRRVESR